MNNSVSRLSLFAGIIGLALGGMYAETAASRGQDSAAAEMVHETTLPLVFTRSFQAGQRDSNGAYMGGTELMRLTAFGGKLFAGNGYFMDKPYWRPRHGDPWTGAQVLVKDSAASAWRVERNLGAHYGRVDSMEVVRFTTDGAGRKLPRPVALLLVNPSDWNDDRASGRAATVWSLQEAGDWRKAVVEKGTVEDQGLSARAIGDHVDATTKVHHVFAGVHNGLTGGRIYRGVYDPERPERIAWTPEPETGKLGGRVTAFAEANGVLYATVGLTKDSQGVIHGGLYRRQDGQNPKWERVWQWSFQDDAPRLAADEWNLVRGLTAVPDPRGRKHEVLVTGHAYSGNIYRIDPMQEHHVTVEFNVRRYFGKVWGVTYEAGRKPAVIAHNQFLKITHPDTKDDLWLVDVWVQRTVLRRSYPDNLAYYLVRRADGTYEAHGTVDDPQAPVPDGESLAGTRTIEVSPFPEDKGRVFYFGGYDVAGVRGAEHNTAWVYRGALPVTPTPADKDRRKLRDRNRHN